jgi:glutamate 5-kinase
VNVCARRVLEEEGRSLLSVGVTGVDGEFAAGDTVRLVEDATGDEFGRGIVRYSVDEVSRLTGVTTAEMAAALGVDVAPHTELIHRDELALF